MCIDILLSNHLNPDILSVRTIKDLGTIERKVAHNQYKTFEAFVDDVQLVFDNARMYNPEESVYHKNANQVELDFKALLSAR